MRLKIVIRRIDPETIQVTYPRRNILGDITEVTYQAPVWSKSVIIARAEAILRECLPPVAPKPDSK